MVYSCHTPDQVEYLDVWSHIVGAYAFQRSHGCHYDIDGFTIVPVTYVNFSIFFGNLKPNTFSAIRVSLQVLALFG